MRTSDTTFDRPIFARLRPDLSRIATRALGLLASIIERRRVAMSPMSVSWLRLREVEDWRQSDHR